MYLSCHLLISSLLWSPSSLCVCATHPSGLLRQVELDVGWAKRHGRNIMNCSRLFCLPKKFQHQLLCWLMVGVLLTKRDYQCFCENLGLQDAVGKTEALVLDDEKPLTSRWPQNRTQFLFARTVTTYEAKCIIDIGRP